jgi:hypothetical protein
MFTFEQLDSLQYQRVHNPLNVVHTMCVLKAGRQHADHRSADYHLRNGFHASPAYFAETAILL